MVGAAPILPPLPPPPPPLLTPLGLLGLLQPHPDRITAPRPAHPLTEDLPWGAPFRGAGFKETVAYKVNGLLILLFFRRRSIAQSNYPSQ